MKKILLFIAAALAFSCSDDLNSGNYTDDTTYILLKKKVETATDGTQRTSTFSYNADKITSVIHSDGYREIYGYTGSLLTEIRHFKDDGLIQKELFLYQQNGSFAAHLSTTYDLVNPANNTTVRSDFAFSGSTVTVSEYMGDETGQNIAAGTATLTISSNYNILKFENETHTINYSFDYQNNPLKQAYSIATIILAHYKDGTNNITTTQTVANNIVSNSYSTYEYNSNDYPVTEIHTAEDGSVSTTQYTY